MTDLSAFHFIRPYWLLAFIPWLILCAMQFRKTLGQGNWEEVCDKELLPYILQKTAMQRPHWTLTAISLASFLGITAMAGPTWEQLPTPVFRNAAALVIILDLSRTMDAEDIMPSRLIRARYKIADILARRKDGQTALIVYAGDAFTVTPLTEDSATINSQLNALDTDIMPVQGNDAALALNRAVELFKQTGLQEGQVLLVTDGVQLEQILPAAESLGRYQLSILGVGTAEGAPIKNARGGFLKDRQGNIMVPKLDDRQLQELARAGGGIYQPLTGSDSDIDRLVSEFSIRQARQKQQGENEVLLERWDDKGPWLLFIVIPLSLFAFRPGVL